MTDDTTREHHTIRCVEEDRQADVIVERDPKTGKVKGVHCDNPKFHSIENWECSWSCWKHLDEEKE